MLHRWSEFLIRRARWVLTAGVLVTILTAVYGIGVFGSLTQGGFDDPATESATRAGRASRRCSATSRWT